VYRGPAGAVSHVTSSAKGGQDLYLFVGARGGAVVDVVELATGKAVAKCVPHARDGACWEGVGRRR
jgi:hypothetical protein